jgi:acyl-coenzyme A thioesterase PaaI-like protein
MTVDAEQVALAEATRRLMDAVVRTQVAGEDLRAAVRAIDAVTVRLSGRLRETMPWPDDVLALNEHSPDLGHANPIAPPIELGPAEDGGVVGTATLGPIHEGPPGAVHGGWVALLLDSALGRGNVVAGLGAYTGELTIRYRRPTPYSVPLTLSARVEDVDGRKVRTTGEVRAGGAVTAEASGLFLMPRRATRSAQPAAESRSRTA